MKIYKLQKKNRYFKDYYVHDLLYENSLQITMVHYRV